MEDKDIVELYWQRSEKAIPETAARYGNYCRIIAYNILNNTEDSEECVNDTWLGAWNSMPRNRPDRLAPYLGKLARWLSLSRLRDRNSLKHGGGEISLALDELSECLDSGEYVEARLERRELAAAVQTFLNSIEDTQRTVFIARYWYAAPIKEIAEKPVPYHLIMSDGTVLENVAGGGGVGYTDDTYTIAYNSFALRQVIDPERVAAVVLSYDSDRTKTIEIPIQ